MKGDLIRLARRSGVIGSGAQGVGNGYPPCAANSAREKTSSRALWCCVPRHLSRGADSPAPPVDVLKNFPQFPYQIVQTPSVLKEANRRNARGAGRHRIPRVLLRDSTNRQN